MRSPFKRFLRVGRANTSPPHLITCAADLRLNKFLCLFAYYYVCVKKFLMLKLLYVSPHLLEKSFFFLKPSGHAYQC